MKITVRHETLYTYSRLVRLAPHLFRLHPRLDGALRLLDHQLHVEPEPAGGAGALCVPRALGRGARGRAAAAPPPANTMTARWQHSPMASPQTAARGPW